MTTTSIVQPLTPVRSISGARHLRYWLSVLGLAIADGLCFLLTYLLLRLHRAVPVLVLYRGTPQHSTTPIDVLLVLAAVFIAARYLSGDYGRRQLFWDGAKVTTSAILLTSVPDLLMLLLGVSVYQWFPVVASWAVLLVIVPLARQVARIIMTGAGIWQIPTALVGLTPRAPELTQALKGSLSLGFNLRWLVSEKPEQAVPEGLRGISTIHSSDAAHIATLICKAGCKQAIVATENMQSTYLSEVVQRLLEVNIPVAIIPSLTRLPLAGATPNYFFGRNIMMLQVRSNVQSLPWRIVKRGFDIVVSILLLALLSPLFVLLSVAIKRSGPGNVTYRQTRIGRHGVPFECLKFRSMVTDADAVLKNWATENPDLYAEYMNTFKLKDDPRITPIGRYMRRTSLDELPQLWNVLCGDMSLVGPRPVVQQELQQFYGPAATLYKRTRPGLTGLWQVNGRSNTSYDERVILDEWYILNWSFWYDIVILIQTVWIVIARRGAF